MLLNGLKKYNTRLSENTPSVKGPPCQRPLSLAGPLAMLVPGRRSVQLHSVCAGPASRGFSFNRARQCALRPPRRRPRPGQDLGLREGLRRALCAAFRWRSLQSEPVYVMFDAVRAPPSRCRWNVLNCRACTAVRRPSASIFGYSRSLSDS